MCIRDSPKATPEEARKFIRDAEEKLLLLGVDSARADWIKSTYITDDTEAMAAKLDEKAIAATVAYAKQATRFDGLKLDAETARKLKLLKLSLTLACLLYTSHFQFVTRIVRRHFSDCYSTCYSSRRLLYASSGIQRRRAGKMAPGRRSTAGFRVA